MNTHFYLTTEFYQHVAICTALIILFALFLGARLKSISRTQTVPVWKGKEYFFYLQALIISSITSEQLDEVRPLVEGFYDKHYQTDTTNEELKHYYSLLLESISKKEKQFNGAIEKAAV